MDALIQLRSAIADAQSEQAKAQSELAQAIANLRKWEDRERWLIEVDNPQTVNTAESHKSIYQEQVKSLKSLVNASVETVSRLEKQLASSEDTIEISTSFKESIEAVDAVSILSKLKYELLTESLSDPELSS